MSAQMPTQGFEDADLMAAEYALGVLDLEGLRTARRRLRMEPSFASEVASWESYFQPWLDGIAPVVAPGNAWQRIGTTLGWDEGHSGEPKRRPLSDNVGFWRGLAFGGVALAALSAIALLFVLRQPPVQAPAPPPVVTTRVVAPDMVASIAADDGRAMLVASVDSRSGAMTLAPVADMDLPADRAAELWLIPAGGAPQSLGVIDPAQASTLTIPAALRAGLGTDALLAVSVEPLGGSPTGQPTGPVVAKGGMRGV